MFDKVVKAAPFPPPYWWRFTIDGRVLTFTLAITLVATLVSGLLPAFLSSRGNPAEAMKEGGRGNSSRLVNVITRVLVVGQIALTAALLIAAMLQIKSIRNQTKLDYGYDENSLYAARLALMEAAYPTEESRRDFFTRAVRALRNNPEFEAAAMTDRFRMTFAAGGQYEVDGQNYLTDRDRPRGNFESVSDGYFTTLGLKLREGRDFTIEDSDAKQPVAIVNASFARKHWGNQSALGHQVRIFNPGKEQPWRTIVGVVPDTLMQGPFDQQTDAAGFYMPLLGASPATQFATVLVRPRAGQRADTLGPALSKAVAVLDSNLPTYFPGTPAQFHDDILSGNRVIATLFSIFGVVAFILSGVGLYGVMSFSVNQRTQEFGIRMALGADALRILRMVMTQGAWQLAIGLVLGVGGIALLLGVVAAAALKQYSVQGQSARSYDLPSCLGSAHLGCRRVVFRSSSPRHAGEPNGSATHGVKLSIHLRPYPHLIFEAHFIVLLTPTQLLIMILDTFRQDVRVGLRILFKEKTFCVLAVLVLALGIAGVTTQFTIVNAFVLRGFSFAHPEQLASVGLIDPQGTRSAK